MTDVHPLQDVFIIDSTVHGYNFHPDNWCGGSYRERVSEQLAETLYHGMVTILPDGDEKWILSPKERFLRGNDASLVGHALFAESDTNFAVYHGVPLYGIYRDGGSPLYVGKEMRERWPGRVALYGPISPWQDGALEEIERLVEEDEVSGIKLYPMDIVDGEIRSYRLDDPEIAFPIIERAQQLGVKVIAMHKAIPQGAVPIEPFLPWDIDGAASVFPDITFEIVHGGFAFLEETAWQVQRYPNVAVNLETSCAFLMARQPRQFAHVLGSLLIWGGEDRIVWSSGITARHPQPFLELFWRFEIPEDMQKEYGYPPLTREIKEKILGRNYAGLHGWDVEEMKRRMADDEFGLVKTLAEPWSGT